ncbi:biogenesis protein MshI [Shewanella inventionis]|uniref:MSHA biogenesis protein MshI1 n=1 Tax=Shewanella inventionis TaxID=1738770 RepID=A0ABQ1JBG1_9GAMM|nr:biogenesis protein MshI [Shewanella inventionis]MCL1158003.1 biogenesis protein MshI [Shewanella inventionis]GGB62865.1 MSHA biogenesis protein MshI1 [Shewanella inventionis]
MKSGLLSKLAFWKSSNATGDIGVFVADSSLWVCKPQKGTSTHVITQIPVTKHNWNQAFEKVKDQFGHVRMQLVLSYAHYQLLQADKPNVEPAEIAQALIWAVKDMVSEPVGNIHLDYFESSIIPSAKVNVVVTSRELMMQIVSACEVNGLTIAGISIEELVLRHILPNDNMAHMMVAHLPQQELLLMVVKADEVLMQRRVRGFNQLNNATYQELQQQIADNLSLEVQRSMDYFESQLRQAPVASITIAADGDSSALANLLGANFNQKVHAANHDGISGLLALLALQELTRGDV